MMATMVFMRFVHDLPRALQLVSLMNRYVRVRSVQTRFMMIRMWAPPQMPITQWLASMYMSVAVALIYAPLSPEVYKRLSLVVLFTYTTTRIGVFRWYARPPSYDKHVLESLRVNVSWLIPLQLVMKLAVVRSSRPVGDFFSVDAMLFCVTLLGWVKRRLI